MQRLGQHFLKNPSITKKIVAALDLKEIERVIEIGPGHGELTRAILEVCVPAKKEVVAIEKDERLADGLNVPGLRIVKGDALEALPEVTGGPKAAPYAVLGNIPYYITGHLLRTIGELEKKPVVSLLMVQREVADRAVCAPPRMNRLAASVQFWADASILISVPKNDFSPPPNVDSAVLRLKTRSVRENISEVAYYATVRAVFAQPRKTIFNNIAQASDLPRASIAEKIRACGVNPEARPQDLAVEDLISLAKGGLGIA